MLALSAGLVDDRGTNLRAYVEVAYIVASVYVQLCCFQCEQPVDTTSMRVRQGLLYRPSFDQLLKLEVLVVQLCIETFIIFLSLRGFLTDAMNRCVVFLGGYWNRTIEISTDLTIDVDAGGIPRESTHSREKVAQLGC